MVSNPGSTGNESYGNFVKIKHDDGYYTLYAHLKDVYVSKGQRVLRGEKIGYMGNTGNAYGVHLHFEVRNPRDLRIDPTPYLDADLPFEERSLTYQAYDNVKKYWLPNVKVGDGDYAGNFGNPIGGIYLDKYRMRVHDMKKGYWLALVFAEIYSFAGLFGSQYGYQKTEFKYLQRFFFSAFARLDVLVKAGKIWTGGVPYPYLFTPNANTSFTVMEESFSQVNPLEFVTDQYASIDLNLSTNGLIFNWIPGIKKLQLREVFGFKCYWGYLSNKNNPAFNNNLLEFPENTVLLNPAEPYMEFSVGIDNIFRILRIDYVRRINYLNNPGIWANGVRVSLNFTF